MNFSKEGMVYCIIWSFGKPPLLTSDEFKQIALANWNINLYSSSKGRKIGIHSLQQLQVEHIYTCELSLDNLMPKTKLTPLMVLDKNISLKDKRLQKIL